MGAQSYRILFKDSLAAGYKEIHRPISVKDRPLFLKGAMMKRLSQNGFTLAEILFVVWIMAFVIVGMGQLFIYVALQAEMAGNKSIAVSLAQGKIEEIRACSYKDITLTDFGSGDGMPWNVFVPTELNNGIGLVRIDSSDPELLGIEVIVSWIDKYGRILGEDLNVNGVLDSGEDVNGNSKLDSPVTLVTKFTRR